jgi:hypothetical protein
MSHQASPAIQFMKEPFIEPGRRNSVPLGDISPAKRFSLPKALK